MKRRRLVRQAKRRCGPEQRWDAASASGPPPPGAVLVVVVLGVVVGGFFVVVLLLVLLLLLLLLLPPPPPAPSIPRCRPVYTTRKLREDSNIGRTEPVITWRLQPPRCGSSDRLARRAAAALLWRRRPAGEMMQRRNEYM